jgi:beta-lactam-binding protein with PASTA domain
MTQKKSKNNIIKRLYTNVYIRNIIYIIFIFVAIVFASKWFLSCLTRHGESRPTPDFKGLHIDDALILADENNIRIEICDSIFTSESPAGTVLEQDPKTGTQVKKNRMIYLVINCITPKKVKVPRVAGKGSLRQAKATLASKGIHIGKISYREYMAMNYVIEQMHIDVETGEFITVEMEDDDAKPTGSVFFGSEIDLVLGLGENSDDRYSSVPNVADKSLNDAKSILIESYLNVGKIIYDSTVKTHEDKLNAVVKTQYPSVNTRSSLGYNVDITLTKKNK